MTTADEVAEFYIHTVTVDTYRGDGAYGPIYADTSAPIPCFLDETRQLVRDDSGKEVVSEASVSMSLTDGEKFSPESIVHLDGRDATVIKRDRRDGDALDLPSHAEITLT